MKKIIYTALLIIICSNLKGQNAYYDALFYSSFSEDLLTEIKGHSLDPVNEDPFKFNFTKEEQGALQLLIDFKSKPFAKDYNLNHRFIKTILAKYEKVKEIEIKARQGVSGVEDYGFLSTGTLSFLNSIGGLVLSGGKLSDSTQSNFLKGLNEYYTDEFKKAQTTSYLQLFESTLGDIGELQLIFPQTYKKLKMADPSRLPNLGKELKPIFHDDLSRAWENVYYFITSADTSKKDDFEGMKFIDQEMVKRVRKDNAYIPLVLVNELYLELNKGVHAVNAFQALDVLYYDQDTIKQRALTENDKKFLNIIHGINLIQKNIRDTVSINSNSFQEVWIDLDNISLLGPQEWELFAGLVYQQDTAYFQNKLKITSDHTNEIRRIVQTSASTLNQISTVGQLVKRDSVSQEDFIEFMQASLDLIIHSELKNQKIDFATLKKIQSFYTILSRVYTDIKYQNFDNTFYYIYEVLDYWIKDDTNPEVLRKINSYVEFASKSLQASNSEEMKNVIREYAAPPSTYNHKRTYNHTLSITGQPGYFISVEKLDSFDNWQFVSGITLPLGFEYTFSNRSASEFKSSGSIGIFFQLIDLGAMMNFRVDDATSTLPDEVTFEQVFSPGVSINYGFAKSPITLGLGWQRTPELREVTVDGNTLFNKGHRVFIRFAWDIPLVNITKWNNK